MKEYIEREAVLDAIKSVLFDQKCDCEVMPEVFKRVQELEAANVAPVVRCRECVHNHPEFVKNEAQWCELCRITINPDDFCSRGDRRETTTCHDGVCDIPGVIVQDEATEFTRVQWDWLMGRFMKK